MDFVQVYCTNMKSTQLTDMAISMLSAFHRYSVVLILVLACSAAVESFVLRGPDNVVGTVDENVTLKCHTNESQKVKISIRSGRLLHLIS